MFYIAIEFVEQLQSGHAVFLDLATSYVCARLAPGKLLATVRARLRVRLRLRLHPRSSINMKPIALRIK